MVKIGLLFLALFLGILFPKNVYARSGCCSHHGGVCGCGCCDGSTLSDTCAPYYPECSQPVYIAPVATSAPIVYTPKPTTPKPSTPKPTITSTRTPTSTPTLTPTLSPTSKPDVKSATVENTPIPSIQQENTEVNTKDLLTGFGILAIILAGAVWIIRKVILKILSIFRK